MPALWAATLRRPSPQIHAATRLGPPGQRSLRGAACRTHHRVLHRSGDEAAWWTAAGVDAVAVAHRLWQYTRLKGAPIQKHIGPLQGTPTVQPTKPEQSPGPP